MTQLNLFLLLLLVNTLLVFFYLLWKLLHRQANRRNCLNRSVVMLLCPAVGPCFFFCAYLFYRLFFSAPVDLEDVVFSKVRARMFIHAEEERERNLAPLEEAIEVADKEELRNLMMNVVRGDIRNSLSSIALAMNSEDTETAHYAASVLQDTLNDFRMNVQKQYALVLEKGEDWYRCADALIEYMNHVLRQKVFTDLEQTDYVRKLEEVCELLFTEEPEHMNSGHFEAVSLRLLEIEDFKASERWCERAAARYPNTLSTWSCLLKLYFASGQRQRFFQAMEELKSSSVVIDRDTLELIRVFQNEGNQ